MLIAKVWDQQANVFAGTDLKNIFSITLKPEKYTAEPIKMERNANVNYLTIFLFSALKI